MSTSIRIVRRALAAGAKDLPPSVVLSDAKDLHFMHSVTAQNADPSLCSG